MAGEALVGAGNGCPGRSGPGGAGGLAHLAEGEEVDDECYTREERVHVEHADGEVNEASGAPPPFSWRKLWAFTGPGFLMSIAYLDPGNIESDLQAGAGAGYALLWILMWATLMGLLLQLLAARLGVATGRHLAELCREHYPRPVAVALWLLTEVAIVGSDIQEVIGSAIAIRLLSSNRIPLWAGVCITAFDGFLFLFLENFGVRKLEALFGLFIAVMAAAFARMFVEAHPDGGAIAKGLVVPAVPPGAASMAVGILGAVIMPHNLFLHSALVQSRDIPAHTPARVAEALRYYTIESSLALFVSFLINLFVVAVFARLFFGRPGLAADVGLSNAGQRLQEAFGRPGFPVLAIWAAGLLAAGQSSTMTGTYAGQFVMAGFLNLRVARWLRVVVTRAVAIVPTVAVALAFGSSDTRLDQLNEWLNVLQSIQLPFAVLPLLALVSSAPLMGPFVISPLVKLAAWLVAALILVINAYITVSFTATNLPATAGTYAALAAAAGLYLALVIYLVLGPAASASWHVRLSSLASARWRAGVLRSKAPGGSQGEHTERLLPNGKGGEQQNGDALLAA